MPKIEPELRIITDPSTKRLSGEGEVWISALGDLMLTGQWREAAGEDAADRLLGDLVNLYRDDELTFANLEVTHQGTEGTITKEPRLISDSKTLSCFLGTLKPTLVNLANNHSFDAKHSGFLAVRQLLDDNGIAHLGAGENLQKASRPVLLELNGITFLWLAYTDPSTQPSHIASLHQPGVNPFQPAVAREEITRAAEEVDHVIVSLHWGVEYCHLPAPDQIDVAHSLIDSGASLIVGHHAHVIQGVETYGSGAIIYNLGNAMATDLYIDGRLAIRQTAKTRSSFLMRALFDRERLIRVELTPFVADLSGTSICDPAANQILVSANNQLMRGITDIQWRARRIYEDVLLRTLKKLDPRVIRSLRTSHFLNFFRNISRALRGQGPA